MCRDFDDMAYMFLIVINSKKKDEPEETTVFDDYHISLEIKPWTQNTRLNKSSLKVTYYYKL